MDAQPRQVADRLSTSRHWTRSCQRRTKNFPSRSLGDASFGTFHDISVFPRHEFAVSGECYRSEVAPGVWGGGWMSDAPNNWFACSPGIRKTSSATSSRCCLTTQTLATCCKRPASPCIASFRNTIPASRFWPGPMGLRFWRSSSNGSATAREPPPETGAGRTIGPRARTAGTRPARPAAGPGTLSEGVAGRGSGIDPASLSGKNQRGRSDASGRDQPPDALSQARSNPSRAFRLYNPPRGGVTISKLSGPTAEGCHESRNP